MWVLICTLVSMLVALWIGVNAINKSDNRTQGTLAALSKLVEACEMESNRISRLDKRMRALEIELLTLIETLDSASEQKYPLPPVTLH